MLTLAHQHSTRATHGQPAIESKRLTINCNNNNRKSSSYCMLWPRLNLIHPSMLHTCCRQWGKQIRDWSRDNWSRERRSSDRRGLGRWGLERRGRDRRSLVPAWVHLSLWLVRFSLGLLCTSRSWTCVHTLALDLYMHG